MDACNKKVDVLKISFGPCISRTANPTLKMDLSVFSMKILDMSFSTSCFALIECIAIIVVVIIHMSRGLSNTNTHLIHTHISN